MTNQQSKQYTNMADAIKFMQTSFKENKSQEELASRMNLIPASVKELFTNWAGTSPIHFLQYISPDYAKNLLKENHLSLFTTTDGTDLSKKSDLQDCYVMIEEMIPAEYKSGGKELSIHYQFAISPFGNILIASTVKGVCFMAFYEEKNAAFATLESHFPNAGFVEEKTLLHENALRIFNNQSSEPPVIRLHLKGTKFQLTVWKTLLKIPSGKLATYGMIAREIDNPKAARAVGTAIGNNPVAFVIPCHRVIQSSGLFGGYMWGSARKTAMIGWEAVKLNKQMNLQTKL